MQFLIYLTNYPLTILILLIQIGPFSLTYRVEALTIKLVFIFYTFLTKSYKRKVIPDLF